MGTSRATASQALRRMVYQTGLWAVVAVLEHLHGAKKWCASSRKTHVSKTASLIHGCSITGPSSTGAPLGAWINFAGMNSASIVVNIIREGTPLGIPQALRQYSLEYRQ